MAESTFRLNNSSCSANVTFDINGDGEAYLTLACVSGKTVAVPLSIEQALAAGAGIQASVADWTKQRIAECDREVRNA